MTTRQDVIESAYAIGVYIVDSDIQDHPQLGYTIDGIQWRDWLSEFEGVSHPHGEEQGIIDFAESPAFDYESEPDSNDFYPWDYDDDGDEE